MTKPIEDVRERINETQQIHVEQWCDGSTPCAVSDGEKPGDTHGHWRGGRSVPLSEIGPLPVPTEWLEER